MKLQIAVLPGDGIGPEVTEQAIKVLKAVALNYDHKFSFIYADVGAIAINKFNHPLPERTLKICKESDAILFGAIGDPEFDNNPSLKIRGILLTMYDKRNKLSSQVEKEARDYFNEKVYITVIPRNVRLSEAPSHGVPVLVYDKSCPGSKSYFSFTNEFIDQETSVGSAA